VEVVEELASTNAELLRRAAKGCEAGLWLLANRQIAGRGRCGRNWLSEEGNFTASLLLNEVAAPMLPLLSLATSCAVWDALQPLVGKRELKLKWPNDLLLDGGKLAGILLECANSNGAHHVVIGIGINLRSAPVIKGIKISFGVDITPGELLPVIASRMEHWVDTWRSGNYAKITAAWLERAGGVGEQIHVKLANDISQSGTFLGLDDNGSLILGLADGNKQLITAGDVSIGTG
jgi:BirA family biotin operon repressor/biotin-[acetyl-CoA-carboxylase] ligase